MWMLINSQKCRGETITGIVKIIVINFECQYKFYQAHVIFWKNYWLKKKEIKLIVFILGYEAGQLICPRKNKQINSQATIIIRQLKRGDPKLVENAERHKKLEKQL